MSKKFEEAQNRLALSEGTEVEAGNQHVIGSKKFPDGRLAQLLLVGGRFFGRILKENGSLSRLKFLGVKREENDVKHSSSENRG